MTDYDLWEKLDSKANSFYNDGEYERAIMYYDNAMSIRPKCVQSLLGKDCRFTRLKKINRPCNATTTS